MVILYVFIFIAVVAGVIAGLRKPWDTSAFTDAETSEIRKILKYTGKRSFSDVTEDELKDYTVHSISEDFHMPDWDIWDDSIHQLPEQYERMKRAFHENADDMSVLFYDPVTKYAKVRGTRRFYLTSYRGCTCRDFRMRKLPCKHMYIAAAAIHENGCSRISDQDNPPLYGLHIATAGRFQKQDINNADNAISYILSLGALYADKVYDADILLCGSGPSNEKYSSADAVGMLKVTPADLPQLFRDTLAPAIDITREATK